MTPRALTTTTLLLTVAAILLAALPTVGGASNVERTGASAAAPRPALVPLASIDPHDDLEGTFVPGPESDIGRHLAWQPINWRINSDTTAELQNEEQVVVNPTDPDNLVATWRDFRLGYRRVGVGYTFDAGITWTDFLLVEPAYPRQSDPGITVDRFGNFYIVVLSYTGNTSEPNGLFVFKSEDGGVTWSDPVAAIDAVPGVFEDKELMACDRTGGPHDGNLYVSWARFWDTTIMNVRSIDGGATYESPVVVSDQTGVQWPVPVVGPGGVLYVAWVHYWPDQIRIDRSFDGGATFGSDITVVDVYDAQTELNGGVGTFAFPAMDCDITGGPHHGRLYVAFMDRMYGDNDVFLTYSDDQGVSWSDPLRINDDFLGTGADQFHPWLTVSNDGVVNVIFYDRRHDPSNFLMDLFLAQSFDGGASFEQNIRVTTVSSDPTAGSARAGLIGEYIGLAAATADRVHPVWTDTRLGHQDVFTAIVDETFVSVPETPVERLSLSAPHPNPARNAVALSYTAPAGSAVDVSIVDVAGRVVRSFRNTPSSDGRCESRPRARPRKRRSS